MSRIRVTLTSLVLVLFAVAACDQQQPQVLEPVNQQRALSQNSGCIPTGTGLTAKVVNKDVVGQTIDIGDCDVGAFFSEDGTVKNATFLQPATNPDPNEQYLVRIEGADVDVTKSEFQVTDDYEDQIIHIGYLDGATGSAAQNRLTGFKRVGILLRGTDTEAAVRKNHLTGVGAQTSHWAENGIQVSEGATGTITDNKVVDHWWDNNDFASSGIIIFGADDVLIEDNNLRGNDVGIAFWLADDNRASGNSIAVQQRRAQISGTAGVWTLVADGNTIEDNVVRSRPTDPALFGILDQGTNTTIEGNIVNGFETGVSSVNTVADNVLTPAANRSPNK